MPRSNITPEIKEQYRKRLLGLLQKGRSKAISSSTLSKYLGIDERRLRILIRELIADGYLIASTTGSPAGFFIAETLPEVQEYAKGLRDRLIEDARRRRDFLRAARIMLGQLKLC